jgi:xanthine/uracil permease
MTDFEFLFALFGLLFGLIVAELSIKFADAIDFSRERPVGILTPALAFLVLTDVTSFWLFIWAVRTVLTVSWPSVFSGVLLAMLNFVAASLVFPRTSRNVARLDDHYWSRKRVIAAVMLFVNLVALAGMLTRATPAWNDWWFYLYFPSYFLSLAGLVISRSRRLDLFLLAWAIAVGISGGFNLLPNSKFAERVGLVPTSGPYAAPHH